MGKSVDPMIGKTIGGFEITGLLGSGGMGVVYRAKETTLNRNVALKLLPPQFQVHEEFLGRFYREAQAIAQLNHPNIVGVHRMGEDGGFHYIALEHVNGCELDELIRTRGRIPASEALSYVQQAASGLSAAHRIGILHRDIKPSNLMVDDLGLVKVMDFGIAKFMSPESEEQSGATMTGSVVGTPKYMSPEQASGEDLDARADIYSLGIVLYQLLTGTVPFQATPLMKLVREICDDPVPPLNTLLPHIPDSVQGILDKALAKKPEDRFQSANEMEIAIDQVLREEDFSGEIDDSEDATVINAPKSSMTPLPQRLTDTTRQKLAQPLAPLTPTADPDEIDHEAPTVVPGPGLSGTMKTVYVIGAVGLMLIGALATLNIMREQQETNAVSPVVQATSIATPQATEPTTPTPAPTEVAVAPAPTEPMSDDVVINHKPTAELIFETDVFYEGEPVKAVVQASDADEDSLTLAIMIDEGFWQDIESPKIERTDIDPGKHVMKVRVTDSNGLSTTAEAEFTVRESETAADNPDGTSATPKPEAKAQPVIATDFVYEETSTRLGQPGSITQIALAADGSAMLVGDAKGNLLLWKALSMKPTAELVGLRNGVNALATDANVTQVIAGSTEGQVVFWNKRWSEPAGKFYGHKAAILFAAIDPAGEEGISLDADGQLFRWVLETGEVKRELDLEKTNAAAISNDQQIVITESAGKIIRWNLLSKERKASQETPAGEIISIEMSNDGAIFATGSENGAIEIWDTEDLKVISRFSAGDSPASVLRFDPGANILASAGQSAQLVLWDVKTGQPIQKIESSKDNVSAVVFSKDGARMSVGGKDATLINYTRKKKQ